MIATCFGGAALAADGSGPRYSHAAPSRVTSPESAQSLPPDNTEVTILRDEFGGLYNGATLENLSKLYWRVGAFDFDDDVAIGNYLKINDCKIYSEYLNDDMEWRKIIDVMRDHLKKNHASFPLNYQFLLKVHLGRYDAQQGGFPLVDRTGFTDVKRIEVDSMDNNREICFDPHAIKDYPRSMVLLLPESFTFNFLKLDEHVAQAYILRKQSEYARLNDEARLRQYEREAFLRLRVTFSQYHGNLRGDSGQPMAILYGTIDGYEIFEDSNQTRLMQSVILKKDNATPAPKMSVPTTGK